MTYGNTSEDNFLQSYANKNSIYVTDVHINKYTSSTTDLHSNFKKCLNLPNIKLHYEE